MVLVVGVVVVIGFHLLITHCDQKHCEHCRYTFFIALYLIMKIDGETVETVADFIFLGSKITADGDCSREINRRLLLGRKVMTNLDSILKSRDITFQQRSI